MDRSPKTPSQGNALGLIGGELEVMTAAAGVLDAICPRRHHLGAIGNGGRAKLAINLILDINRAGLAEGLVFAERVGLDPAAFLKVARESAAYSQIMDVLARANRQVALDVDDPLLRQGVELVDLNSQQTDLVAKLVRDQLLAAAGGEPPYGVDTPQEVLALFTDTAEGASLTSAVTGSSILLAGLQTSALSVSDIDLF